MKTFLVGLALGIFIGASGYWYLAAGRQTLTIRRAQDSTAAALDRAVESLKARLQTLHLSGAEIQDELSRTGQVVRRSARDLGAAMADATADARIEAAIHAKLLADPELSTWKISVNSTDGRVTLSGRVSSHEQVGKAMLLALETDGVRQATSTLQVRKH